MKKTTTLIFGFLFLSQCFLTGQVSKLKYQLEYSPADSTYNMYIVITEGSSITAPQRAQFNAQISIVTPAFSNFQMVENYMPRLNNNNGAGGTGPTNWVISSNVVSPAIAPNENFYSITPQLSPTSFYNNLYEGDEVKLFKFKVSPQPTQFDSVRLYDNISDPKASDPGMNGGNFRQGFTIGGLPPDYNGNLPIRLINNAIVKGYTFIDANGNKLFDSNETALPNCGIKYKNYTYYSDANGYYRIYVDEGEQYFTYFTTYGSWKVEEFTDTIDITSLVNLNNAGFEVDNPVEAAEAKIFSSFLRCNNVANLYASFTNTGNQAINGYFTIAIDPKITTLTFNPQPTNEGNNVYTWPVNNLLPGKVFQPTITFGVPAITSNIDSLHFFSVVKNDIGGIIANSNFSELIRCGFDPNDKLNLPNRAGEENYTLFNEELDYIIRFQNTGNDTAFNITVVDVLDKNLDLRTLRIKQSSHEVKAILTNDTLKFIFENINLVDSTTSYLRSQGYVAYSIKPKAGVARDEMIKNTADIFFDKNVPVVTNTTINTMTDYLPCSDADKILTQDGNKLKADPTGKKYEWYDCKTNTLITTTTTNIFKPTASGEYYARIFGDNCAAFSSCYSFLFTAVTDIANEINIYPNPVTNMLYIDSKLPINKIFIYNLLGNKIYEGVENQINMNNFSDGIYNLVLNTTNETKTLKIVKVSN